MSVVLYQKNLFFTQFTLVAITQTRVYTRGFPSLYRNKQRDTCNRLTPFLQLLSVADMTSTITLPLGYGADGVVLWGNPSAKQDGEMWAYINSTLGPLVSDLLHCDKTIHEGTASGLRGSRNHSHAQYFRTVYRFAARLSASVAFSQFVGIVALMIHLRQLSLSHFAYFSGVILLVFLPESDSDPPRCR